MPHGLIVDDYESHVYLFSKILARERFTADIARTGVEAIKHLAQREYDVILLDMKMPQMNGFDVLDYLRRHNPNQLERTLIVSVLQEHELRGIPEGPVHVLKPLDLEHMSEVLKMYQNVRK